MEINAMRNLIARKHVIHLNNGLWIRLLILQGLAMGEMLRSQIS